MAKIEGAARRPAPPPPKPVAPPAGTAAKTKQPEPGKDYTVKSGDTLSGIAKRADNDPARWHEIYEANKKQINDPNLIKSGQKLKIPGEAKTDQVERDTVHAPAAGAASANTAQPAATAEPSAAGPPRQMRRTLSKGITAQPSIEHGSTPGPNPFTGFSVTDPGAAAGVNVAAKATTGPQSTSAAASVAPASAPAPATGLTPAQQTEVDASVNNIHGAATNCNSATTDEAKCAAAKNGAQTIEDQLKGKDPAVQKAILDRTQQDVADITASFDKLSRDETKEEVGHLNRACESLGQDNAKQFTDAVAQGYQRMAQGHDDNDTEFTDGIKDAVKRGDGALFGSALTESLATTGQTHLAEHVADATASGIKEVREDYEKAKQKADKLDAELGMTVQSWQGVFSEEEIQAGIDSFREAHKDAYGDLESKAGTMASTLEGSAYGLAARDRMGDFGHKSDLVEQTQIAMQEIPALSHTDAGASKIADAATATADGKTTFLTEANALAGRMVDKKWGEDLRDATMRSVALRCDELARAGKRDEIPKLLQGAAKASGDADLSAAYNQLASDVEALNQQGLAGVDYAKNVASKVYSIANGALKVNNPDLAARFKALGPALGLGSLALDAKGFIDDPSVGNAAKVILDGAGVYGSLGSSAAAQLCKKAGLWVSLAFSAFDTASAIQRGDYVGAAFAAAPMAGAAIGAGVGVWFCGIGAVPGAAIGAAIGGLVNLGYQAWNAITGNDPIQDFEKDTDPFLRGALEKAGLPPAAAGRLRDVDDDLAGIGRVFDPLAKQLGMDKRQLLEQISKLPDEQLQQWVKLALEVDQNAKAIQEAQDKQAKGENATVPDFQYNSEQLTALADITNKALAGEQMPWRGWIDGGYYKNPAAYGPGYGY